MSQVRCPDSRIWALSAVWALPVGRYPLGAICGWALLIGRYPWLGRYPLYIKYIYKGKYILSFAEQCSS